MRPADQGSPLLPDAVEDGGAAPVPRPRQSLAERRADPAWRARVLAFLEESCRSQGVPVKVTDPRTLAEVAEILRAGAAAAAQRAREQAEDRG